MSFRFHQSEGKGRPQLTTNNISTLKIEQQARKSRSHFALLASFIHYIKSKNIMSTW